MVVLKAGETMNQSDLMPSRMERARLKVADFAAERKGQPLGLVAYAGTAHLVLPPTRDTSVVATMAAEISPEIMPKQGDNLVGALQLAVNTLGDSGGSIVVLPELTFVWWDPKQEKLQSESVASLEVNVIECEVAIRLSKLGTTACIFSSSKIEVGHRTRPWSTPDRLRSCLPARNGWRLLHHELGPSCSTGTGRAAAAMSKLTMLSRQEVISCRWR